MYCRNRTEIKIGDGATPDKRVAKQPTPQLDHTEIDLPAVCS